jgi:hypothetical protein
MNEKTRNKKKCREGHQKNPYMHDISLDMNIVKGKSGKGLLDAELWDVFHMMYCPEISIHILLFIQTNEHAERRG